jgi:hypothetical protein
MMYMRDRYLVFLLFCFAFFDNCSEEANDNDWTISNYTGSYKNIEFNESLIKEFASGIYKETEIPDDIKLLTHGRIEIDFRYDGGALNSFMPLLYYGSINKNHNDNAVERPAFHLVVEIGHYNVTPLPVEYLFYTISTFGQPQYCRDTFWPVCAGVNYTFIIDKRPEGIILQLKEGENLINIFPHAFFPDSSLMFFKDVASYIEVNKGDTLEKVLMVGKGFAGFDKGLHEFNGTVTSLRIYKYIVSDKSPEYEFERVRNQHTENQLLNYIVKDNFYGKDKYIFMKYEFWPYKFESGILIPNGAMQTGESDKTLNSRLLTCYLKYSHIGFYKVYLQTVNEDGNIINSATKPFDIWVYPKEWDFEFYKN